MTEKSEADRWIGFEEAFTALESRMGLPRGVFSRPTDELSCREGAMVWLLDHAILVHETPSGFRFDRVEFEAILQRIDRVELPDA